MKKILSFSMILILSGVLFRGCKKDKGEPPVLPPPESMSIDFSNFISLKKGSDVNYGPKGIENSSWEFASSVAAFWRVLITINLAIPVATFKAVVSQTPVYLSEKNWQWSYNANIGSASYKARLTGLIGASDVKWKMYITKEGAGGFSEFLWFEGTSKLDGSGGQWILNESYLAQNPILQIDWTKTGASIGSIKYTYVKNDTFKNNYIEYGTTAGPLYDSYYKISFTTIRGTFTADVEWNSITFNGRVKCIDYLGNTNWYCWDANKINSTCL
jgi:hypothetical protein